MQNFVPVHLTGGSWLRIEWLCDWPFKRVIFPFQQQQQQQQYLLAFPWVVGIINYNIDYVKQGSQICQIWRILPQNCSDDSTEATEGVTLTPEIFGNKHSFVLTFFATNTIYVNWKCRKP